MYYVYEWFIVKTGEIIYVGKGTKNRYKVKKHNKIFNQIIKRYKCESRIIAYFEKESDAFNYEYERINILWEKNQCLCNIYKGGMGGTTSWWTDERRKKYSEFNCMKSEKQRERMSKNNPMKVKKTKDIVVKKISKKVVLGEKVYNSLKDLAKEFNVYDTAIQYWLKRGYGRNSEPCYYYGEKPKEIILKKYQSKCKQVLVNGELFESVKSAAKYLNVDDSVLIKTIKNKKLCKGNIVEYVNQQPSHENSK